MALSASIQTGLLGETQRAASSITNEIREQVSMLERAAALEQRMPSARSTSRAGNSTASGWTWSDASERSVTRGLPTAVAKDRQKQEFKTLLKDEIRSARSRAEFSRVGSGRQMGRSVSDVVELMQGNISLRNVKGGLELGEMGLFGSKFAKFAGGTLGALSEAAPALMLFAAGISDIESSFEMANRAGTKSRKFDVELKKTFRRMNKGELKELRESIGRAAELPTNGELESFDERIENSGLRKDKLLDRLKLMMSDPQLAAAALNHTFDLNESIIDPSRSHFTNRVQANRAAVQKALADLLFQEHTNTFMHASDRVKAIKDQADNQRLIFSDDPVMAGNFHDQMRQKRKLEKYEYEDKQRDWGKI